jgi:hypothetical protein
MTISRSDPGYERLTKEAERPQTIRDWTHMWDRLQPLGSVNGNVQERILRFCQDKGITAQALLALEPRLRVGKGGRLELAFRPCGKRGRDGDQIQAARRLLTRDDGSAAKRMAAADRRRQARLRSLAARRG